MSDDKLEKKACCGPLPDHVYFRTTPAFVKRKLDENGKQVGVSLCDETEAYALRCPECGRCYPKDRLMGEADVDTTVKSLGDSLRNEPDGGAAEMAELDDLQKKMPRTN